MVECAWPGCSEPARWAVWFADITGDPQSEVSRMCDEHGGYFVVCQAPLDALENDGDADGR